MVDLGKIASAAAAAAQGLTHPRDVFNALPAKAKGYDYLRGPQEKVLDQWDLRRAERDVVIKMNTGGGKTIVGLLVGQATLNENAGPVAYLCPDKYLAAQVQREASNLGLDCTDDFNSASYARGRAILVDTFQRVFNGQSVFGVGGSAGRAGRVVQPGAIIVDDAHACLNKAEQAFRLSIPYTEPAYQQLLELFEDALDQQGHAGLLDLKTRRYSAAQQVPAWAWADKQSEVMDALHPLSATKPYKFSWPLLVDVLHLCRAVFTADAIEIAAPCLPVETITGFQRAARRVYLTATLADDGVLITDVDAAADAVRRPIVPATAGDIGDRLILVPQQTYPDATEEELRDLIVDLSTRQNVVVIVPSHARADYWAPSAAMTLDRDSLEDGVETLRANPRLGLTVLVNRYDGVDLPGDACHVLVIDGLPEALDGIDRVDQSQLVGSDQLVARQVQRLEQGMGRATRSNEDHCVVLLLGARLAERLYGPFARACFSPATRAQLELSEQVAAALEGSALDDLRKVIDQCLGRDPGWVKANRAILAPLRYGDSRVSTLSVATREAFDLAAVGDYRQAEAALQPALTEAAPDPIAKGYLLQQLAAYQHPVAPQQAQATQLAAFKLNRNLMRPLDGIAFEKLSAPSLEQAAAASALLQREYGSGNELVIGFNALVDDLAWGPRTRAFEDAWAKLAWHLGFAGQQPEREYGRGPDGLWALTGGSFLVCEIKSDSSPTHPVYKSDAEQLSNSMDWFREHYPSIAGTPVLVGPRAKFDRAAAVPTGCRVVNIDKLGRLRSELVKFAAELADLAAYRDPERLGRLLGVHGFTAGTWLSRHTVPAISGA